MMVLASTPPGSYDEALSGQRFASFGMHALRYTPATGIGLLIAYLSGRIVASQIYAIPAANPLMLGAAIVLIARMTAVATIIPAWRASRLAPSGVLHTD
jgi:ABC-type lipoprotein release transport system permease subunit